MQERDISSSCFGRGDLNLDMTCSLSLYAHVPERSSPSRVRFAAQNRRALDRSGAVPKIFPSEGKGSKCKGHFHGTLVLPPVGRGRRLEYTKSSEHHAFLPGLLADY